MRAYWKNYIDGQFVDAADGGRLPTETPATGEPLRRSASSPSQALRLRVSKNDRGSPMVPLHGPPLPRVRAWRAVNIPDII